LISSWEIDLDKLAQISRDVIIFDDVLTTGSHFAALKQIITKYQPTVEVRGVFLAKTNDLVDPFGLSG
jgi:predicted amidophosphoribosyltransferase